MGREQNKTYMYGKHALIEAVDNAPRTIKKVFLSPSIEDRELRSKLKELGVPIETMRDKQAMHMVGKDTSHQGVIAIINTSSLLIPFPEFAARLKPTEDTALVILDELTDPQNVGAIIRSAAAFGASGVLIPSRRQAPITGAVAKASAGMVFRIPIVSIGNINYTIADLKERGFMAYGLAMKGSRNLNKEIFNQPSVFIVGNEGRGVREKTLELCDVNLNIPINQKCESLNAAAAAAVVLYQWSAQHHKAVANNR